MVEPAAAVPENNLRRRPGSSSRDATDDESGSNYSNGDAFSQNQPQPATNTDTPFKSHHDNGTRVTAATSHRPRLFWPWLLLHLVACGIYVTGLILQQDLHSSVECDMTFSQRQLIPIPLAPRQQHPKYGLYKFVDQRDPRPHHRSMLRAWLAIVGKMGGDDARATNAYLQDSKLWKKDVQHHCTTPAPSLQRHGKGTKEDEAVTVLYIPGHWGSYMQSRSIGAHGIQLTGARDQRQAQIVIQALAQNAWLGSAAQDLSEFVVDVYAIDFQQEGAALHAQFLLSQTAFVAQAIQHLVNSCQLTQVVMLGHSIGGYVSRLVPILYPETRPYIQNIITLGSPHARPVFGWESSVHNLHQTFLTGDDDDANNHVLVAISGGLRDEMIPPAACSAKSIPNSLSLLAPDIMELGPNGAQPQLGMDHRAIVWCKNLLSIVRAVVYTLVKDESRSLPPKERLEAVQAKLGLDEHATDYDMALKRHQSKFMSLYGFGSAIAMESSMLYHAEVLVGLFVLLGCLQSVGCWGSLFWNIRPSPSWSIMEGLRLNTAIFLSAYSTNFQLHILTNIVLTLVANSVFGALQWIMGVCLPYLLLCRSAPDTPTRLLQRIPMFSAGIFLVVVGLQCIGKVFSWQTRICLSLLFAVYFATISLAVAIAAQHTRNHQNIVWTFRRCYNDSRFLAFAATFFLVCPFLVAGKIVALMSTTNVKESILGAIPTQFLPETGLLALSTHLLLPIGIRVGHYHFYLQQKTEPILGGAITRTSIVNNVRVIVMSLTILYMGPSLFQMGHGYRAGDLLAAISWLECIFVPFEL